MSLNTAPLMNDYHRKSRVCQIVSESRLTSSAAVQTWSVSFERTAGDVPSEEWQADAADGVKIVERMTAVFTAETLHNAVALLTTP
jgi:hypothetical protein